METFDESKPQTLKGEPLLRRARLGTALSAGTQSEFDRFDRTVAGVSTVPPCAMVTPNKKHRNHSIDVLFPLVG